MRRDNIEMNLRKILVPLAALILLLAGHRAYGWPGVALASGGLVLWLLLHWNRTMTALQRAAQNPIGFVASAVMLNAKLRPGVNLLHVIAITRSLGTLLSPKDSQPEVYCWTDDSASSVTCEFLNGRLVKWQLKRPAPAEEAPPPAHHPSPERPNNVAT